MYRARVERDSLSPAGVRLTSFVIQFPRVVLAEVVTHRRNSDAWGAYELGWCERTTTRDVSKNSASSRAIPLARMIKKVYDDPYVPERFSGAGAGMQGHGWLEGADHEHASKQWLKARDDAVTRACLLLNPEDRRKLYEALEGEAREVVSVQLGVPGPAVSVHKQDVNRLLEPWCWVTQIVTSSAWDNFFGLRCHRAAHPAFQRTARMMYLALRRSAPTPLEYGQWHLPFVAEAEQAGFRWSPNFDAWDDKIPDLLQFSAARCAWLSYESHEKDGSPEAMRRTFSRLLAEVPVHASPCEHQATPFETSAGPISNLRGWLQARKLLAHEEIRRYRPPDEEVAGWGIDETNLWPQSGD